jgi:pre-mRNA-processing factor 6
VKVDPDYGDAWAYYYKFELIHGTKVCALSPDSTVNVAINTLTFPF